MARIKMTRTKLDSIYWYKTVAALIGDPPETIYKTYAHSFGKDKTQASNIMDEIIALNKFSETKND